MCVCVCVCVCVGEELYAPASVCACVYPERASMQE